MEENGAERRISGRLSPADSTLNRNGVFVSGILFALRDTFREVADIAFPEIEVHYVEDGSTGQAIEIEAIDFLEQVDGKPVKSLQELSDLLAAAAREKGPALLTLRRLDIAEDIGLSSIERTLQVEGLRWIGESQNRP